jgi:predicted DsbA family dithiol-disulfide isomerase
VASGSVEVTWLPYELHPDVPRGGLPVSSYFPPGYLERAEAGMRQLATQVGLTMRRPERLVNSRMALATAEFARERGVYDTVHRALFRLHWEGPGRLDDPGDLGRVVEAAGLDPAQLRAALEDGRYEAVLDGHRRQAQAIGVNAVPAHVFGRRYLVMGAQPEELFRQVLNRF